MPSLKAPMCRERRGRQAETQPPDRDLSTVENISTIYGRILEKLNLSDALMSLDLNKRVDKALSTKKGREKLTPDEQGLIQALRNDDAAKVREIMKRLNEQL
ncbi:hypothetical protein HZC21_02605 [Candidatus Peregrinibacteria bacterium]|nr:hypothetical protein [Candidatus Peregrinibacteria bacterium]